MNRAFFHAALAAAMVLAVGACATVTISNEGERRLAVPPSYEERKDFFLGGLIGEHDIDVGAVCRDRHARQMQTRMNPIDGVLTFLTFGIYAPRTARVWCG